MGLSEGALFYIRVVHTDAPSNTSQPVLLVLVSAKEEDKKRIYTLANKDTPLSVFHITRKKSVYGL